MINVKARAPIGRALAPVGRALARAGISPDVVTIVGTVGVSAGALAFYPRGHFLLGTIVIVVFVFSDLLDGTIARARGGGSLWGAFLDSSLDRVGDAAIFGGILLYWAGRGDDLLRASLALYCLAGGSVTSYLKARAEGLGMTCNVGLAERSERLIIILAATGFAGLFGVDLIQVAALWLLAVVITVTVAQRLRAVHAQAAGRPAPGTEPVPTALLSEPVTGSPRRP